MNKKWLKIGGTAGISAVVMVTTALSAMADASGYEVYKTALKNTKAAGSVTVTAKASLQDNGASLLDASGSVKADLKDRTGSGTVSVNAAGTTFSENVYKTSGQTVFKSSANDVYYVKQEQDRNRKRQEQEDNPQMAQQVETVIDAMVGNLKDAVTLDTHADGSKEVSLQLDNAQVPALLNALVPIGIKQALGDHKREWKSDADSQEKGVSQEPQLPFDLKSMAALPQLTQDIKVDKINVLADINAQNEVSRQIADVSVSGKDANGTAHVLTLHLEANLNDFNATSPDTVDLTGKSVQTLKGESFNRHHEKD